MKALSIRQPWAWLVIHGYKDIENRKHHFGVRGEFLVHASKQPAANYDEICRQVLEVFEIEIPPFEELPKGALVGKSEITDCVTESDSPWFHGPNGLVLKNSEAFGEPIPWKGRLGFFNVDLEL